MLYNRDYLDLKIHVIEEISYLMKYLHFNQKHPENLKKGDTIAIVSTARKVSSKELVPAILFAKKMGLEVQLGITIDAEKNFAQNVRVSHGQNQSH